MFKARKRLFLLAALLTASAAFALGMQIRPIDKSSMTWTGNTRQEMGKTLAEYKCIHDHVYWIPVN